MSKNMNIDFENHIDFYNKKSMKQRGASEACPNSVKLRWVYACSCLGFLDVEEDIRLALDCLFLAMEGCKITMKDMDPIIAMIIRQKFLDDEKN